MFVIYTRTYKLTNVNRTESQCPKTERWPKCWHWQTHHIWVAAMMFSSC